MARAGHDGHRVKIDRVDDDRGVDPLRHLESEQRRQPPRGVALLVALQRVPAGRLAIEKLVDGKRRAEIDVHAPVFAPEVARHPHERAERFALLRLPFELGDQRAALEQLFVAEIHRHQQQRPRMLAHEALDRHAEQPAFRRERASAAAPAALDEVRDGKALDEHRVQVFAEHRRVQRLALEAAAQEEGAAAPQQRPHERKIEVGARGDVRRCESLRVDEIRQQQVIDVAAMVGQIDEPLARRDLGELFSVVNVDPVVEASPQPREQELHRAHDRIAEVRSDLPREFARPVLPPPPWKCASRADSSAIASCNASEVTIARMRLRRCERSGPIDDSRIRRK